jgi:hypothetical protein
MIIERTDKEILIRIPGYIALTGVQRIIDYIRYQEITLKSQTLQDDVDNLATKVNKEWWVKN